ncbi:pantoate--beta-alanine ligase [Halomonas faecis]|uniref:pantoate--beta-alanine ligase n=1 Tax=Halomonas faecis TaxID=1562110 RepID=UPI0013D38CB2|nr:pantoate--beta-alanine ligase [Halomonas faecis]
MRTLREIPDLREALDAVRRRDQRIALVPTMGNLHAGHLALVEAARRQADVVVATIFVNPLQFGPSEDLDAYPRTLTDDQARLEAAGCDLLFTPDTATLYPHGLTEQTQVCVPGVSEGLCGGARPGHFDGVATVVSMLFNLVQPHLACFGEKDYQQLAVIRKLVADLHFPIEILGVPIVRAEDGLALSSRNGYLSEDERLVAPMLYRTLCQARNALEAGEAPEPVLAQANETLRQSGFTPDYLELRARDLGPVTATTREAVLLAAARLGPTRLIDNLILTLPS